ncbi:MAG: DUF5058 family protein [Actinomycetales bacterium]
MTASVPVVAAGESTDILAIANSPILWFCAIGVFAVIFVQSFIYIRAARAAGPDVGISRHELNGALRAGAVASIGPSLAVVLVAIALLALFGTPAVLVRIGLIGSAGTEVASANIAASTMGATLGGPDYTQAVFVIAFTAMSLSGAMWMIATLLLTPALKRGSTRLRSASPAAMVIIPAAALLAAFGAIAVGEIPKSNVHAVVVLASAAVMAVLLWVAIHFKIHWLREWALGFAILVGLGVAFAIHPPVA